MTKEFKEIEKAPILGLEINWDTESGLISGLKNGRDLLCVRDTLEDSLRSCKFGDLKNLRNWLNDVVEFCEENYPKVSFEEAKKHMEDGGKASFQAFDYCFNVEQVLCYFDDDGFPQESIITIDMLNSNEWKLL